VRGSISILILVNIGICQYSNEVKRQTDPDVLLLRAAADPTRLAILRQLSDFAEVCACDFTACCDVSQPTVSHHLKVLRDAGWIEGDRRGTWIWYSLRPQAVARFRELAGAFGPSLALPVTSRRLPVVEARA
jgi:ArsR family transcriptional regulator